MDAAAMRLAAPFRSPAGTAFPISTVTRLAGLLRPHDMTPESRLERALHGDACLGRMTGFEIWEFMHRTLPDRLWESQHAISNR